MRHSISVVIPCHNASRYLGAAIKSVTAQHRAPLEIFVVDDASTDDSREIAACHPVRCLALPSNAGPGAARNLGCHEASGDLVAFLDADDLWDPDHLATVGGLLDRFPGAILAYSAVRFVGSRSGTWAPKATPEVPFDAFEGLLRHANQPPQMSTVVRREALIDAGGYPVHFRFAEDYCLWLRLARMGPFVCTKEVTASYRWHDAQGSVAHRTEQIAEAHRARLEAVADVTKTRAPEAAGLMSVCRAVARQQLVKCWRGGDRAAALAVLDVASRHGAVSLAERVAWRAVWGLAGTRRLRRGA